MEAVTARAEAKGTSVSAWVRSLVEDAIAPPAAVKDQAPRPAVVARPAYRGRVNRQAYPKGNTTPAGDQYQ